jgi:hypothetical protein
MRGEGENNAMSMWRNIAGIWVSDAEGRERDMLSELWNMP